MEYSKDYMNRMTNEDLIKAGRELEKTLKDKEAIFYDCYMQEMAQDKKIKELEEKLNCETFKANYQQMTRIEELEAKLVDAERMHQNEKNLNRELVADIELKANTIGLLRQEIFSRKGDLTMAEKCINMDALKNRLGDALVSVRQEFGIDNKMLIEMLLTNVIPQQFMVREKDRRTFRGKKQQEIDRELYELAADLKEFLN